MAHCHRLVSGLLRVHWGPRCLPGLHHHGQGLPPQTGYRWSRRPSWNTSAHAGLRFLCQPSSLSSIFRNSNWLVRGWFDECTKVGRRWRRNDVEESRIPQMAITGTVILRGTLDNKDETQSQNWMVRTTSICSSLKKLFKDKYNLVNDTTTPESDTTSVLLLEIFWVSSS